MRVAVAGGTGVVGRHVVRALADAGHEPVVLARSRGVDLTSGEGLDATLDGAAAVVDVSNVASTRRATVVAFFEAVTERLLAAGQRAGVRHHVALSVVGCDRVPLGYYAGKLRQEERVLAGAVPASVLRATQFHEFPAQLLAVAPGPVALLPSMPVAPVAAREVGEALAELAVGPAVGRAPVLAGPEEHQLVALGRRVVRARGQRRLVVGLRAPVAASRAARAGALLPAPPDGPARLGRQTFDAWLAETGGRLRPPSPAAGASR